VSILGSLVAGGKTLAATIDAFHLVGAILIAIAVVSAVLSLFLTQPKVGELPLVNTVGE
jgi:hypothetical protein